MNNGTSLTDADKQYVEEVKNKWIQFKKDNPSLFAEGSVKFSNKETLRFIEISIGSLAELDTQLLLSKDLGYYTEEVVFNQIKKVNALLLGLKEYLKNNMSEAN